MRKLNEYDFKKLSDSRITYMRNPPRFTIIFTFVVLAILIGTICWSAVAIKAEEVKIQGTVKTENSETSYAEFNGKITEICVEEGATVYPTTVIMKFDSSEIEQAINDCQIKIQSSQDLINVLQRMNDNIQSKPLENPFNIGQSDLEDYYYYIYEAFKIQYQNVPGSEGDQERRNFINNYSSNLVNQMQSQINTLQSLDSDMMKYEMQLEKYTIKAQLEGIINFDTVFFKGDVIQAGTKLCTINPEGAKKYITALVSSNDRSRISVGEECNFTIDGLIQSEYGSVSGKVETIATDGKITEKGVVFQCTISFDKDVLKDSRGKEVQIVNGMTASIWVKYNQVTYLHYYLEKLGFKL